MNYNIVMQGVNIDEAPIRTYSKSNIIVYQSDAPSDGFLIKKGVVRVYQISPNGESITITFCTVGDVFPIAWLAGETSPSMYYYEAFEDLELMCLNRDVWNSALNQPGAHQAFSHYILRNYQSSLLRVTALEQAKARDKIAYTVFYLMYRHAHEILPGIYKVDLKLKHQDIAALIGLTRETTAIEMHALQEAKVLSYQNQRYLIKREELLNIINEDSLRHIDLKPSNNRFSLRTRFATV
jgi:CRP/FNR family transcriptional regulator